MLASFPQNFAALLDGQQSSKAYDTDKYGRTVGVVEVNGVNVNESLIRSGLGVPKIM